MQFIKLIVTSPYLNFVSGIILFASGVSESLHEYQEMEGLHFGIHHGIILFSLVQILKTIPEIFEGLEFIRRAEEGE